MRNSFKKRQMRMVAQARDHSARSDADIQKEIDQKRAEREMLNERRETDRLRVLELSTEIAVLEMQGPIRKLQRKLGGIEGKRPGDVVMKTEPAVMSLKSQKNRMKRG